MRWTLALVVLVACGEAAPRPPPTAAEALETVVSVPSAAATRAAPPLAGGLGLVVLNPTEVDIDIYGAYLVDEAGVRGTMRLWPHRHDCPELESASHLVAKNGGELRLPFPSRVYGAAGCELGEPLLAGSYVLRLDSGYGEELYAAAAFTLPRETPVELRFESHAGLPPRCTAARARRAARLALSGARALSWLPQGFFNGCHVESARCGATYELPALPPNQCTITLHRGLVRIARPAGVDASRGLSSWVDAEVVYASRPEVTRTSASRVEVAGRIVVISGTTSHHIHAHGGDAAGISRVELQVRNPHARALAFRVESLEFLADHSCALPQQVSRRPALVGATPTTLPPGDSSLEVRFAGQQAYQAHCDRFATRVTLLVEGQRVAVSSEHEVTREESFGQ